jgi:hypothetical protein
LSDIFTAPRHCQRRFRAAWLASRCRFRIRSTRRLDMIISSLLFGFEKLRLSLFGALFFERCSQV